VRADAAASAAALMPPPWAKPEPTAVSLWATETKTRFEEVLDVTLNDMLDARTVVLSKRLSSAGCLPESAEACYFIVRRVAGDKPTAFEEHDLVPVPEELTLRDMLECPSNGIRLNARNRVFVLAGPSSIPRRAYLHYYWGFHA
jgi:hypothetical protein